MTSENHEAMLEQVIAEYLMAEDLGAPPDRNEFLHSHPELAEDLIAFFREHDRFAQLAAPLQTSDAWDSNDPEQTVKFATPTPVDALTPGNRLLYFGDYEIREELGRGGMGVVYRARQVSLNRFVALKMIRSGLLAGEDELRRFQNEAEAVALLDHRGIVPVYEVGELEGKKYFSMKLIETSPRRPQAYRDDPRSAALLVAEAADAVAHAHARGVLHRDLKLANLLIDVEGRPHLTDFGLAKRMSEDIELTQSGVILGTPAYMSPEQATGQRSMITTATDIYGLGAVLYALLTGQPPFSGDTVVQTLEAVRTTAPKSPTKLNDKIPRDLETICLKCLEKDPKRRYPTARALADDLQAWLEHRPINARRAGFIERTVLFARRSPASAIAICLTVAVVLLTGIGGTIAWLWLAAEYARSQAETARTQLAAIEYGRTIEAAHEAWRQNNVAATLALLDTTSPDLRGWEWHHVHSLCHRDLLRLNGLDAAVSVASYTADGSQIVTLDGLGTTQFWDASTGYEIRSRTGHPYSSLSSFDGNFTHVVASDKTGNIGRVWDVETGAIQCTLTGHRDLITSASFNPSGSRALTASIDGTAKIWDAQTGNEIATLDSGKSLFSFAQYSGDGERIATAGYDQPTKIWDANTGVCLFTLGDHTSRVEKIEFSNDGSRIVTAHADKTARTWDALTGNELLTLKGHTRRVLSASFSLDGLKVVTSSEDQTARVWDALTGEGLLTIKGPTHPIWTARFNPDGSRVITTATTRSAPVRIWNALNGEECFTVSHNPDWQLASFSPDGEQVVLGPWGNTSKTTEVRSARTGQLVLSLSSGPVTDACHSPDGQWIVTTGPDNGVRVWDASDGSQRAIWKAHDAFLKSAAFSPDSTRIVTTSLDSTAKVWNAVDGSELLTLKGASGGVDSASFSPDGKHIATGGEDKSVRIWDAITGNQILALNGHTGHISSVCYDSTGNQVVSASHDRTAIVWDLSRKQKRLTLRGHTDSVWSANFSPDGTRILTASSDFSARLWDATSGAEVLAIKGHEDAVISASFSSDGTRIVTGSKDGTAKIWDDQRRTTAAEVKRNKSS